MDAKNPSERHSHLSYLIVDGARYLSILLYIFPLVIIGLTLSRRSTTTFRSASTSSHHTHQTALRKLPTFFNLAFKLNGLSDSIVSDRDPKFTSREKSECLQASIHKLMDLRKYWIGWPPTILSVIAIIIRMIGHFIAHSWIRLQPGGERLPQNDAIWGRPQLNCAFPAGFHDQEMWFEYIGRGCAKAAPRKVFSWRHICPKACSGKLIRL